MDNTIKFEKLSDKQLQLLREEEITEHLERTKWKRYFNSIRKHWL